MRIAILISSSFILLMLGAWIQSQLWVDGDVAYLLHATKQFLAGGRYSQNFFETNPPMILYLYSPVIILSQILGQTYAVRIYFLLLSLGSIFFSYSFLKKIPRMTPASSLIITLILMFIVCILPLHIFAQREHLLIILVLPYIFLSVLRLEEINIARKNAFFAGFFAALGFSLKPFFLMTWILIEGAKVYQKKAWHTLWTIESIIIFLLLIIYFISIFIFQPDYIHVIVPLVWHYYLPETQQPLVYLLSPPYVLFCFSMMLAYVFGSSFFKMSSFAHVIFFALLGFIMAFLYQGNAWYYHVYPALSMAYLMLACFLIELLAYRFPKKEMGFLMVTMFMILILPLSNGWIMLQYHIHYQSVHPMKQIAKIMNSSREQPSLCCFPQGTHDCFPLIEWTGSQYGSRFPSLWWYQGLKHFTQNKIISYQINQDTDYLIKSITADLMYFKTQWIIFNNDLFAAPELIKFLNQEKGFREEWTHYRYLTTIANYSIYMRKH